MIFLKSEHKYIIYDDFYVEILKAVVWSTRKENFFFFYFK